MIQVHYRTVRHLAHNTSDRDIPRRIKDHVNVTVKVGDPDSGKYEPKVTPITKDFGTPTTTDDVTKAVTVPNYPSDKPAPKVSVDDPSTLPNGKTPGEYSTSDRDIPRWIKRSCKCHS